MGSLGSTARQVSFNSLVHKRGLDLSRGGPYLREPGHYVLDSTVTTLRAGQMVAFNATGNLVLATGSNGAFAVAKWGSIERDYAVKADEAIVLNGTTATNLSRGNVSNVTVRSAAEQGGTLYVVTTDYTVNAVNGTITRVSPGATPIPDGATVYVTYTYALTAADDEIDGNFFTSNTQNRTTGAVRRVTVIMPNATIFSAAYAGTDGSGAGWALTGTGHKVYCSAGALPTPISGTEEVGRVVQLPIANDPYLGWEFKGVI